MNQSLKKIAFVVTLGTLASKSGGFVRQLLIAGAFGVGVAYDAYNYSYIIPGFFLILLGGVNGPFHNSMVSVLSRKSKEEKSYILATITTLIGSILILTSLLLFTFSDQIIYLIGPGLAKEVHEIAKIQIEIMSPIALIAGLIGIGFGSLNASNEFLIPSISPIISSFTLIVFIGFFWIEKGDAIQSIDSNIQGGVLLALATLIGAFLQWFFQAIYLIKNGLGRLKLSWDWKNKGVQEVLSILAPATLSSGMLQINVFTDLFFASSLAGAAAGLSYATFLIQAPLGLFSNAILIPLLPTFSKLSKKEDKEILIKRIHQGLIFSLISMISLGAIFVGIGEPIVDLVYRRGAFNQDAVELVTKLLIAYGIGMPVYLCRDLLVRVFYALSDGKTPFKISSLGILLNIIFDWFLIGGPTPWGNHSPINLGAQGLVFSTALVNFLTCLILLFKLNKKINGIPLFNWFIDTSKLMLCGFLSCISAWISTSYMIWPNNTLGLFLEVIISSLISLGIYGLTALYLGIKEIDYLLKIISKKIINLSGKHRVDS